jgi:hypothetical protein
LEGVKYQNKPQVPLQYQNFSLRRANNYPAQACPDLEGVTRRPLREFKDRPLVRVRYRPPLEAKAGDNWLLTCDDLQQLYAALTEDNREPTSTYAFSQAQEDELVDQYRAYYDEKALDLDAKKRRGVAAAAAAVAVPPAPRAPAVAVPVNRQAPRSGAPVAVPASRGRAPAAAAAAAEVPSPDFVAATRDYEEWETLSTLLANEPDNNELRQRVQELRTRLVAVGLLSDE